MITVFAGGVGAARFLQGIMKVVPQNEVTIISNTGDDLELFGLHISPDIDIVLYHLAGIADEKRGWGIKGDKFQAIDALSRFGYPSWFRIGDQDLATSIHRSTLMGKGQTLTDATAELTRSFDIESRIIPMCDEFLPTMIETDAGLLEFQRYFVERQAKDRLVRVHFPGVSQAKPSPGVIEAITKSSVIIIAPSNPLVSIGPILSIPGIRDALRNTKAKIVAVSPIINGSTIKGPAAKMLREIGLESSSTTIARLYADFLDFFIIDKKDAKLQKEIESLPRPNDLPHIKVIITNTVMKNIKAKSSLAHTALLENITESQL